MLTGSQCIFEINKEVTVVINCKVLASYKATSAVIKIELIALCEDKYIILFL